MPPPRNIMRPAETRHAAPAQAVRSGDDPGGEFVETFQDRLWRSRTAGMLRGFMGLLLAVGMWTSSALAQEDQNDPIEPVNRAVYRVNWFLDGLILEPAARIYRMVTPQFVRTGVTNFLANLRTPVVFVNDVLQGEPKRAELTLGRFMFNTIMGVGGLVDIGGMLGMPERHSEDFGQTLAVYGVGSGPYLMLPLLGPSNVRDTVGQVVDLAFDPLTILGAVDIGVLIVPTEFGLARTGAEAVSFRERNIENVEELRRSSIDEYAAIRTFYRQFRANEIRNGAPADLDDIYDEDLYEDPDAVFEDPDDAYEDPEAADAR
jgi:phospholipid-binding lipoprotein MlaA